MIEVANREVLGGQLSEPKTGLAAALLAWGQTAFRNGFASISRVRVERRLELVERLELGGKRQLVMVVCDGQRYLVGVGGDSVHSIVEMGHCVEELRNFGTGSDLSPAGSMQSTEQAMRCNS